MRSTFCVLALAALAACATLAPDTDDRATAAADPAAAERGPEAAAQAAAEAWLAHVDAGDYERSWQAAAERLRQQVSAEQWEQAGRRVRQQTGAIRERTLQDARHTTELPQAPPGEYVVLVYRTSYEQGPATEQIVMRLEDDGEWRAVGYFVRP